MITVDQEIMKLGLVGLFCLEDLGQARVGLARFVPSSMSQINLNALHALRQKSL